VSLRAALSPLAISRTFHCGPACRQRPAQTKAQSLTRPSRRLLEVMMVKTTRLKTSVHLIQTVFDLTIQMLKETFFELVTKYKVTKSLTSELWLEIEKQYLNKKRHYHTLHHLDNLLKHLTEVKTDLQNQDAILFSLYYHDIIYNPLNQTTKKKVPRFPNSE
jgi:hypothetical protein